MKNLIKIMSVCVNKSQFFCHQLLKKGEDRAKLD